MAAIFSRWRRGLFLLRELRGVRADLRQLTAAVTRLAEAVEVRTALDHPLPPDVATDRGDGVEVTYVDSVQQHELMDIELRLTAARGEPPTEEEMLEEVLRRRALEEDQVDRRSAGRTP